MLADPFRIRSTSSSTRRKPRVRIGSQTRSVRPPTSGIGTRKVEVQPTRVAPSSARRRMLPERNVEADDQVIQARAPLVRGDLLVEAKRADPDPPHRPDSVRRRVPLADELGGVDGTEAVIGGVIGEQLEDPLGWSRDAALDVNRAHGPYAPARVETTAS